MIPTLCSDENLFSFKTDCFLCGKSTSGDRITHKAQGNNLKENLLQHCQERKDEWSNSVQFRLLSTFDLPSVDAKYHHTCFGNFTTGKNIPEFADPESSGKKKKSGRKVNEDLNAVFVTVAQYLDSNFEKLLTVNDLIEMMNDQLKDSSLEAYGYTHMKSKLNEYFKGNIIFTSNKGKLNVVSHMTSTKKSKYCKIC